jgi:hypothetical protein
MTKTNQTKKTSIADEFQNIPLSDQRLNNRLINIASTLERQPEKSIPDAYQNWPETKAAYNFFANEKVSPSAILASHCLNTIERMTKYPLVLLIQDTSVIDFSTHKKTKRLGPCTMSKDSLGLLMHSVLVVSPDGVPLGLLYQDIWSRENYPKQKRNKRYELPIEAKESFKWLKAMEESLKNVPDRIQTVTVGDREADIYELFKKAHQLGSHLVIRAVHNRRVIGEYHLLYEQINNVPEKGQCLVEIPRKPERNLPPRQAKLSVRCCPVNICPAHTRAKSPTDSILLYAIYAQEIETPEGEEPIEWLLLTTIPVTNMSEAVQKIEWYRERWKIERFHYTLKSGCRVEDLQLETKERLCNALTLYSIIAWRLTWLTYQARVTPNLSCEIILKTQEWQALCCVVNKTEIPPDQPPTLHEAIMLLAKLGGFLGRKHDGEPGVKVLWRGLQKLNAGMQFLELINFSPFLPKDMGNE